MGTTFIFGNRRNWEKIENNLENITILNNTMIYSIISELKKELFVPIKISSKFFGVSRSAYYKWKNINIGFRQKQNQILLNVIKEIRNTKFIKVYGSKRITKYINSKLHEIDFKVNHKRIERICKEHRLNSKFRAKKRTKRLITKEQQFRENIINRNFNTTRPLEKIFGDITQINTNKGSIYLSAFIDVYDNKILGSVISTNQQEDIVLKGIKEIIRNHKIKPNTLIVHTDRGSIYTGYNFNKILEDAKIIHSMSRSGHCPDNAPIERLWGILKDETCRLEKIEFNSLDDAKKYFLDYINFYNNERISKK